MIPFSAARAAAVTVFSHPADFEWTVQGFGMLRTYWGDDKRFRLNIWDSRLAVPDVSVIHDHPWDFTSWVLAGNFYNHRYVPCFSGQTYEWQMIRTGEGGGPDGTRGFLRLLRDESEWFVAGDSYKQTAEEIHESGYQDGTVTLNERIRRPDGEHARVFWPVGKKWIDAEPRPATPAEIERTLAGALPRLREVV